MRHCTPLRSNIDPHIGILACELCLRYFEGDEVACATDCDGSMIRKGVVRSVILLQNNQIQTLALQTQLHQRPRLVAHAAVGFLRPVDVEWPALPFSCTIVSKQTLSFITRWVLKN